MKTGDIVKHKLSGDVLRIKRINESITTCEQINKPLEYKAGSDKMDYQLAVCALINLQSIN
jgi:hypothetical protein